MSAPATVRTYKARAETTRTFGRILCAVRQHHFVVDGPVQNDCPGEAHHLSLAVASGGVEVHHETEPAGEPE
ncbi:MAG TPA: hypothetical protein VKK31_27740 [Thermoanaerobaculia bacterium]|nr:hypothetical protein [Thermoanaerobaculia bacterium]